MFLELTVPPFVRVGWILPRELPTLFVESLQVRELTAGVTSEGTPDDNAEHSLHGTTTVSGAPDTIILLVEERAHVQDLLSASRLNVGLTTAPDPGPYSDPYEASPYDDSPYPETLDGGASAAPAQTGFTVDEGGNVRTSGFTLVKQAQDGVVLRAPNGAYYAFTVNSAGEISTTGRSLGTTPP